MPKQMNSCQIHRKPANRKPLDHIMLELPFSQAGKEGESGRHKCAYCAYEKGYAEGLRKAGDALKSLLLRETALPARNEN
ncbi:MAG: hypothetical protein OXI30_20530 [Chloroflexota bacterium]|nr:hypothetical protein [Chloroflexota bacterium]MYD09636.1 hypothetical protein [Chloroflexota bacterium]